MISDLEIRGKDRSDMGERLNCKMGLRRRIYRILTLEQITWVSDLDN